MGPFEAGRRAVLAAAEIYEILAKYFSKQPQLRAVFTLITHEYRTEAQRVDKWIARWTEEFPDVVPDVDVRQLAALVSSIEGFAKKLRDVELMEPEAAVGLASSLERELAAAHAVRGTTIVGGFFNEVAAMSREHREMLKEALQKMEGGQTGTVSPSPKADKSRRTGVDPS